MKSFINNIFRSDILRIHCFFGGIYITYGNITHKIWDENIPTTKIDRLTHTVTTVTSHGEYRFKPRGSYAILDNRGIGLRWTYVNTDRSVIQSGSL